MSAALYYTNLVHLRHKKARADAEVKKINLRITRLVKTYGERLPVMQFDVLLRKHMEAAIMARFCTDEIVYYRDLWAKLQKRGKSASASTPRTNHGRRRKT